MLLLLVVEEIFLLLLVGVWTARIDDDGVDTLPEAMDSSEALDERKGVVDNDAAAAADDDDEVLERLLLFTFIGLQLLNSTGNSLASRSRLASFSAALYIDTI
jgi:hypothetical protein